MNTNTNSLAAIATFELDISERSLLADNSEEENGSRASGLNPKSNASADNIADVAQTASAARAFPNSGRARGTVANVSSLLKNYTIEPESEAKPSRTSSRPSTVKFGSVRNALTKSIQQSKSQQDLNSAIFNGNATIGNTSSRNTRNNNNNVAVATAVSTMDEAGQSTDPNYICPNKGVLKKKPAPMAPVDGNSLNLNQKKASRLTKVSAMYDLDGDGELNEVEQVMRNADRNGDGQLSNEEVKRIVEEQLKASMDYGLYKKVIAGLICLIAILALSNFGTSWASAILTKEVTADEYTGTIQSKATGEVMAVQEVAYTFELEQLGEEEFEERRRLVDAEMAEDIDHEDHQHRKLGKKKRNKCGCSKISYDEGKIKQRDLEKITRKCDGYNTVNMKRKWKNKRGGYDEKTDQICGPGTEVKKKGKKKRNKNKNKVKVVNERVTFERKKKKDKNKGNRNRDRNKKGRNNDSVTFDCNRGNCYTSGQTLVQKAGDPCDPTRDHRGASQCDSGLVCYDPDGHGTGQCVQLGKYARQGQLCNIDYQVDACRSGLACICDGGDCRNERNYQQGNLWDEHRDRWMQVRTGYCQAVRARSGLGEICDVSNRDNACISGYKCLSFNGHEIWGDSGLGQCARVPNQQSSNGVCDLGNRNACGNGLYCQDQLQASYRNGRNGGNGGRNGNGGNNNQGAQIIGPSGSINTFQSNGGGNSGGNTYPNGIPRGRSKGTGKCTRSVGSGGTCSTDEECGYGNRCKGLGAGSSQGGVIQGPSGTIVYGNGGGSQTGYCGR